MSKDQVKAVIVVDRAATRRLGMVLLALQAQCLANDALKQRIRDLESSHSWRLTGPLRRLRTWFGGSRGPQPAVLAPAADDDARQLPDPGSLLMHRIDPEIATAVAQRQLFVDVTELSNVDLGAGIQRVVRRLLAELLIDPPCDVRVEPVRLAADGRYVHARAFLGRMLGLPASEAGFDRPVQARSGDQFLGLDLIRDHATLAGPALRDLRQQGVAISFVVYDLLPLKRPEWFPRGMQARFTEWLRLVADHADTALCISRSVQKELQAHLDAAGGTQPRLDSFPLGADLDDWMLPKLLLPPLPADVARFLVVGTIEPRKGHAQTLAAFEQLWAAGDSSQLVIAGRVGWATEALVSRLRAHPERGKRLHWIEGGDDAELVAAFRDSTVLLAPSSGEGFGLPLVEAAAHGLPILARYLPVFREVAGNGAEYFSGDSPQQLAAAITSWLAQWRGGDVPSSAAVAQHTWQESAQALKQVLGLAPGGGP